jgi:hypothetical protein
VNELKKLIILLALTVTMMLIPTAAIQANKPLTGNMELDFYPTNPIWRGTISGDISGKMYFTNVGTGKRGDQTPGKTIHFAEIWLITDEQDNLLLTGTDKGVVSPNSDYRMSGVITDASEEYAHLIGRNVHMSGYITWQEHPEFGLIPETAPGTFRICGAHVLSTNEMYLTP